MLTIFQNYRAFITRGGLYCLLVSVSQQAFGAPEYKKGRACIATSIPKSGTGLLRSYCHIYHIPCPSRVPIEMDPCQQ